MTLKTAVWLCTKKMGVYFFEIWRHRQILMKGKCKPEIGHWFYNEERRWLRNGPLHFSSLIKNVSLAGIYLDVSKKFIRGSSSLEIILPARSLAGPQLASSLKDFRPASLLDRTSNTGSVTEITLNNDFEDRGITLYKENGGVFLWHMKTPTNFNERKM